MTWLWWTSGILLLVLGGLAVLFFALHMGSGEEVPRLRAKALWRWCIVVVLATFNIWIFNRVFDVILFLWRTRGS